jgi:hypothetical protein
MKEALDKSVLPKNESKPVVNETKPVEVIKLVVNNVTSPESGSN